MATAIQAFRFSRRRWLTIAVLIVAAAALTYWVIESQLAAQSRMDRVKAALDADEPAVARRLADEYLASRPRSAEAHFRAAQAARRCGDVRGAESHLDDAAKFNWDQSAIEVERALIRAQSGDLRSAEQILVQRFSEDHPDNRYILAVLVPALMAEFRWIEANAAAAKWTDLQPQSARAWSYRGEILERLRKKNDAVTALRRATELDPSDRRSRFALARMLLETKQSAAEAAGHLDWLHEVDPENVAVVVELAVCREAQGRVDEAEVMLDRVIAQRTQGSKAYYHRGRLELNRGRAAAALPFLRRADDLDPGDTEVLYSLFLCLQQVGTPAEARAAEERWKRSDEDLKQVAELARAIAANPHEPDLRREMGEIFLRNGRERDGVRWLESALRERPDHKPSHRLLADHYERAGQADLAAHHRSLAEPPVGP
ncbi:MAG TPA: tetratricopeptide repeat protein [Gemmataceae bacterium]|nr:tetratricopeptide repeat protein [Gemmataceae bacterium]